METLSEAVDRLTADGYTQDFRAERDGLRAVGTDCVHPPEAFEIDAILRFEGESDPADESGLFALRCDAHGMRGTYVVAYGPGIDPRDAEMVRRLADARRR